MRSRILPPLGAASMAAACLCWPAWVLADPCKAIPDRGPMPAYLGRGAPFSGPVVYVGDGDGLCVDVGATRATSAQVGGSWVEVRLADFYAPELHEAGGAKAKSILTRLVMGRRVSCVAEHRSHDRVVAVCRLGRQSVGDAMRRAGVQEGGRGR